MPEYYPNPTIKVSLSTHAELDGTPIWNADLPEWTFGDDENPDWLPEDKSIDSVLQNNFAVRDGDNLVIESDPIDGEVDKIVIHKSNLKIVDGPDFEDVPTADE